MPEVNATSRMQRIIVDPASYAVSIVYAGHPGPPGPTGPAGPVGPPGQGIIPGGAANTVLAKKTNADFDMYWAPLTLPPASTIQGTVTINGATTKNSNLILGPADATNEGGQIAYYGAGTNKDWFVDNYAGVMRFISSNKDDTATTIPMAIRPDSMIEVSGWYIGKHPVHMTAGMWPSGKGANPGSAYNLLTYDAGGPLLLNADGSNVEIRQNNGLLGRFDGNGLYLGGGRILDCEAVYAGWTGIYIGASHWLGFYNSGDDTWIRSRNAKGIWLDGGWFGCDGGISVGRGGALDANYRGDFAGHIRVDNTVYCSEVYAPNWSNFGGIHCGNADFGDLTVNYVTTRSGYRFTSNGGWDGYWANRAYVAQNASGGAMRTGYAIHPGGVAKSWEMMQNNGYVNLMNEDSGWYGDIYANSIVQVSQRRGKQDIQPWPSVDRTQRIASAKLNSIDVISYRVKKEFALIQAETMQMHVCPEGDCGGTLENPCYRVREWMRPTLGIVVEDVDPILPEVVSYTMDDAPGGIKANAMLAFLIAVCKEQQIRIEDLERKVA
jgi:hypothetical protein